MSWERNEDGLAEAGAALAPACKACRYRLERHRRMLAVGLLDPWWSITDRDPDVRSWDELAKLQKDERDLRMAVYAARGILADTVLLFMSDNGGYHEEIHRGQPRSEDIGTDRSFESYGRAWANLSNAPFRDPGHFADIMPTCLELANAAYLLPSAPNAHP